MVCNGKEALSFFLNVMKKLRYYLPSICMLVVIFGFSSQNGHQSGSLSDAIYYSLNALVTLPFSKDSMVFVIRKCAHMTEFGLLALTLYYGMYKNGHTKLFIKAILLTFVFACMDEFHQLFISGRAGQFRDVLIDTTGGLLFLCLLQLIRYLKRSNS